MHSLCSWQLDLDKDSGKKLDWFRLYNAVRHFVHCSKRRSGVESVKNADIFLKITAFDLNQTNPLWA